MEKMELKQLMEKANKIYLDNFLPVTYFERALFFSWGCKLKDCKFCYMSTQPLKDGKIPRRSTESILAEAILCKKFGWRLGFFSGGVGAYTTNDFLEVLKKLYQVSKEKIWLNIGALSEEQLKLFKPYTEGVSGSIETVNKKIHDRVCPSKPVEPYLKMFKTAEKLGLKRSMTIILGLGETIDDFDKLKEMIKEYNVEKISIYSLNPHKGTIFENSKIISKEYHAEWIAKTRIAFPKIDIQCGIWLDRVDRVSFLLKAGANSVTKFPILRYFNSKEAKEIEKQAEKAGRTFAGSLTKIPKINIDKELNEFDFSEELKQKIKLKFEKYLEKMKKR